MSFEEGVDLSLEDPRGWSALSPIRGQVIEVYSQYVGMGATDSEVWSAYLVKRVSNRLDGSSMLECHFLGSEDVAVEPDFAADGSRVDTNIHLCLNHPCLGASQDLGPVLHVTRCRLWTRETFSVVNSYVPVEVMSELPSILAPTIPETRGKKPATPKVAATKRASRKTGDTAAKEKAKPPKDGKDSKPARKTPQRKRSKPEEEHAKDAEALKRQKLRDKLREQRERLTGNEKPPAQVEEVTDSEEDLGTPSFAPSDHEDSTPALEDMGPKGRHGLTSGDRLRASQPEDGDAVLRGKVKMNKDARGRLSRRKPALEDIRTGGKKDVSKELIAKAVATAQVPGKTKKKAKKDKTGVQQLSVALSKILTQANASGSSKDTKKKKKKRKVYLNEDGVIESCSQSSNDSWGEEPSDKESSGEEMEAPLRKKAKEKPGSVLAMLVKHVREKLDQSALVDLNDTDDVTSGIKISSYFSLFIKGTFPSHLRELRELHHLATCLDLLRQGGIAQLGDALAARFVAIHQSMLDSSWTMARHLELYPYEEPTAMSAGTTLAARKHAKLFDKMQGVNQYPSGYGGYGKGKGGKNPSYWNDPRGDNKGDPKGKGKPRKGKGKGNWYQNEKGKDWEKNKERNEEKPKT